MPDGQQHIIKGCIAGNRTAQAKLYNQYAKKMFGVCMWYARNRHEAEEILQDGFLRVFTYLHKYSGKGSFEGWMRKIMVNAALFKYRNKSFLRPVVEFNADIHNVADNTYILAVLHAKDLVKLVQTLTPVYRMVFNLYVLEGLKHREIAGILGITEGTSKSNLADAKAVRRNALSAKKKLASL